ncbi:MAG: hypothetical protein WCA51_02920 [Dehalococcoidia bacterium]
MSTKKLSDHDNISDEEMVEAISRSGYLLERRVATLLGKVGYKAVANRGFIDSETGKSREYDVYAYKSISVYNTGSHEIYPTLICECKNNPRPIAFFIKEEAFEPFVDEVKVSGIPAKIWLNDKCISIQEFAKMKSFHHYCKPEVPVSTQCCTFEVKKDRSSWMASHGEELYETFRTMIKALEHAIDEDFSAMSQWFVAEEPEKEFMDLSFYYPVVIFQGDLFSAHIENNRPILKKCEHIQYNPEFFSFYHNEVINYHVDVISEEYLQSYLNIIDREMLTIKKLLQKQKKDVLLSIYKIIEECKGLKKTPKTYRKYLEFDSYR